MLLDLLTPLDPSTSSGSNPLDRSLSLSKGVETGTGGIFSVIPEHNPEEETWPDVWKERSP